MAQIVYEFPDDRLQTLAHAIAPLLVPDPTFDENGDEIPLTGIAFLANRLVEGDIGTAPEHIELITEWSLRAARTAYEGAVGEAAGEAAIAAITW